MTFNQLKSLIDDIDNDERRMEVRFGCDCGCGGDIYSIDDWEEMCYRSDVAQIKLEKLGVTFK